MPTFCSLCPLTGTEGTFLGIRFPHALAYSIGYGGIDLIVRELAGRSPTQGNRHTDPEISSSGLQLLGQRRSTRSS
jgi:hypothetical protein